MKHISNRLRWTVTAAIGLLVLAAANLPAQVPTAPRKSEFTIKRLEVRFTSPPTASGEGGRGVRDAAQAPWARLECEFDSTQEWSDDVQVKWYVLLQGTKQTMATGDDTYIYIKKGRRHVVAMYMHPFVLERWVGASGQNAIQDVGVELWWQGRLITFHSYRSQARTQWWQQFQPTPGLLMRVSESPWASVSFAEYEWSKYTTTSKQ